MIKTKFNNLFKHFFYLARAKKTFTYPTVFQLETTNRCPMNCIMCPRSKMTRKLGNMDFNLFKKIVDQLNNYTELLRLHHFGDPLVHPEIDKFVEYCSNKDIKTSMSVNPTLLNEKIGEKLIKAGLTQIQISLDGVDDESYKKIRGRAANYKLAEDNIKKFLELKRKLNSSKPKVLMGMVLMKPTEDILEKFKEKWKNEGVDEIVIKPFSAFGDKDLLKVGGKEAEHIKKYALKYPCYWPWRQFVILWDGRVVPCCWAYDDTFVIGDLNKQTLKEIWNSKKMRELREQQINESFKDNKLCRECIERYGCPGFNKPIELIKYAYKRKKRRD